MLAVGAVRIMIQRNMDLRREYLAGRSIIGIWLQKMANEVLRIITDVLPVSLMEDNCCIAALFNQVLKALASEGRITAKQSVGNDAEGPHIDRLSVTFLQHHFWSCVAEGSCHCGEDFVLGVQHFCNTEIGENEVGVSIAGEVEEVFRLEI